MKPHIICHMMAPLDGRLIVSDWAPSTGLREEELISIYDDIHKKLGADAWLVGRSTGEEFSDGVDDPYHGTGTVERPVHVADKKAKEYAVLLDKDGRLRWNGAKIAEAHIIVILGSDVSDSHLLGLTKAGVSYIVSSAPEIELRSAIDTLGATFGIKRLLLEGGARTNGEFLKAGLVDEISLVIFPAIGGKSDTPTIFEGGPQGLAGSTRLALKSHEPSPSGTIHLMYEVIQRK